MRPVHFALAILLLAGTGNRGARAEDCTNPLVKTASDAGKIAFAMWHVVNPKFARTDEGKWVSFFAITLNDCVWYVEEKPQPGETYSTFRIKIGAKDGRFLGAQVSD